MNDIAEHKPCDNQQAEQQGDMIFDAAFVVDKNARKNTIGSMPTYKEFSSIAK
jgi:hypothetical protein